MTAHELATAYVDAYGGRIEAGHDGAVMVNTGFPMPNDFDEALTFIVAPMERGPGLYLHDGNAIVGHLWQQFVDVPKRPDVLRLFSQIMEHHHAMWLNDCAIESPLVEKTPEEIARFVVALWALVSVVYHVEARPLEMLRATG